MEISPDDAARLTKHSIAEWLQNRLILYKIFTCVKKINYAFGIFIEFEFTKN